MCQKAFGFVCLAKVSIDVGIELVMAMQHENTCINVT